MDRARIQAGPRGIPAEGLVHEAFIYSSDDEFITTIVPFVLEGVRLSQPTVAVLPGSTASMLRDALGRDAGLVSFVDGTTFYRSPANAIAGYNRRFDTALGGAGAGSMRVVAEIGFGSGGRSCTEWTRYESALNGAFARRPVRMICTYDTREYSDQTIVDVERVHPVVRTRLGVAANAAYAAPSAMPIEPLAATARSAGFDLLAELTARSEADLAAARRAVVVAARSAGLPAGIVDDVTVAVTELARESLRRGAPAARVRIARAPALLSCEVFTATPHEPLLADDSPAFWIAHLIGDRVEIVDEGVDKGVRLAFDLPPPTARQRILRAASLLIYQKGIRATGINAIIAAAGVAKATFYHHFPTKDALLVAWLREPEAQWFDRIRIEAEARVESPELRLLALFDVLGEWLTQEDFRGSAFLNAAAEITEEDHAARAAVRAHTQEILAYLQRTAREANLPRPELYADQLQILIAGAIVTAVATGSPASAQAARAAAERLLLQPAQD